MAKAKKEKVVKASQENPNIVTVADLAEEFGLPASRLRAILRRAGLRAPETDVVGFGPKAKYEWAAGSKELGQVKKLLSAGVAAASAEKIDEEDE